MRRGIVYLGGAGRHLFDQSAALVADRIARSIRDKLPHDQPFSYRVQVKTDAHSLAPDIGLDIASIEVGNGDTWEPIIDILEVKYLERFAGRFARLPPLTRALKALWLILRGGVKRVRARRAARATGTDWLQPEPRRLDKAQAILMSLVTVATIGSVLYWLFLGIVAVIGVPALFNIGFEDILGIVESSAQPETDAAVGKGWIVILIALVLFLAAAVRKTVVEPLDRWAVESFAGIEYQLDDGRFLATTNAILDAIEYATHRGYGALDLLAFSLGSVLATDAIFPRRARRRVWSTAPTVENWITIGFPYDLIRWSLPKYFDRRQPPAVDFCRWINVVVQDDFLGTAFTERDGRGIRVVGSADVRAPDTNFLFKPERWVKPARRDWFVPLRRAINHEMYWNDEDARAPTCFSGMVETAGWIEEVRVFLRGPVSSDGAAARVSE
jgi:hypothetical protein